MDLNSYLQLIRSYEKTIIKELTLFKMYSKIEITEEDLSYYLNAKTGYEDSLDDHAENYDLWWENYSSVDDFLCHNIAEPLTEYYRWLIDNLTERELQADDKEDIIYDDNPTLQDDFYFNALVKDLPNSDAPTLELDENPLEGTSIDIDNSLQDDYNFNSLVKHLTNNKINKAIKSDLDETELNQPTNSNPYYNDYLEALKFITDTWEDLVLNGQKYESKYYGCHMDVELHELKDIHEWKVHLENTKYAYTEFFEDWKSLSKNKKLNFIHIAKLAHTISKSKKEDLMNLILDLIKTEVIYFIASIPHINNIENRAFCIFTLNAIFNPNLQLKSIQDVENERLDETSFLNSGLSTSDIMSELLKKLTASELMKIDEMFKIDWNYQDENGNTTAMNLLNKINNSFITQELIGLLLTKGYLGDDLISANNEKLIELLLTKDVNIYLKNKKGQNLLDYALSCNLSDEAITKIASLYGPITKMENEFVLFLARVNKNIPKLM